MLYDVARADFIAVYLHCWFPDVLAARGVIWRSQDHNSRSEASPAGAAAQALTDAPISVKGWRETERNAMRGLISALLAYGISGGLAARGDLPARACASRTTAKATTKKTATTV